MIYLVKQQGNEIMITYQKLKTLKTLLIDDDPFIRNSMELAFCQKNYPLRVVDSAEEGLRALERVAFDIIICDYHLPGMNGLDFFRQVISRTYKTINVLISAGGDHDAIAIAYAIGVNDYLPKPFTLDTLWATLVMHEARRKASDHKVISLRNRNRAAFETNWSLAGFR
jgi:DNA-binding response OmpR family regulator